MAGCVAVIATATVRDYFWTWREDPFTREVYFSEMTSASTYMRELPDGTIVLLYSDRAPFDLEMRRMIAPRVAGTDRSADILNRSDIPLLVRTPHIDQHAMREALPAASRTSAAGAAGWAQGILGPTEA